MPRSAILSLALTALMASTGARAFDLQGHRGARGLAPENTLAAFRTALEIGVDTLELDVGITRDGQVVVAHDPRLNPAIARDAAGRWIGPPGAALHELTLAELQRHDVGRLQPGSRYAGGFPDQRAADGERIPTLASVFQLVKARGQNAVRFNIETKIDPREPALTAPPEEFVRRLLAVIAEHGMGSRVSLQSFDWRTLRVAARLAPEIPRVALTAQQGGAANLFDERWTDGLKLAEHGGSVPRMVKAAGAGTWSPLFRDLDAEALREAHALGLSVVVWTVNERADIDRMLDLGVDGIISDRPDRVREALAARGRPLPPPAR